VNRRAVVTGVVFAAAIASTAAAAPDADVTLTARPTVARWFQPIELSGRISSTRAGERVAIEVKPCGQSAFTAVTSTTTHDDGTWGSGLVARANSLVRATWKDETSVAVRLWQRPGVVLTQLTATRFRVTVTANRYLAGRKVLLQRYERRLVRWTQIRSAVLAESGGGQSTATLQARVGDDTLVRAVLPRSEARPCYLAGYSNMLRMT
jgi:hypothetical protein